MYLVKTISKTKTHTIKVDAVENGKKVTKEKQVPNTYLWLVLDSGIKILVSAVKKEDKRLLESHARIEK